LSVLEKVRKWIDGDTAELALEQAARDAQVKPRSKSEDFIVTIAREVESVMQREMVPLPQGTTIIPSEYTIFLSTDDDREWQGVKRRGLEQGLYHILAERAKEIAGKKKLETRSFVIELRIDGTLEKGTVRVQHSWEDSTSNKTGVLSRPKSMPNPAASSGPASSVPLTARTIAPATAPDVTVPPPSPMNVAQTEPPATVRVPAPAIQQAVPLPTEEQEIMTRVAPRVKELYKLEIWHNGVRQNVVPIYQNEISIGRGSRSKPVDIPLSGDVEISRRHATIGTDGNGTFWVINEGRNPSTISSYELPSGQRVKLNPGVPLSICSYMLRIQPLT